MVASSRCRVQPVPATPAKPLPPPSAYSTAGMRQAVAPPLLSYVQARDGDWHHASIFLDAVSSCGAVTGLGLSQALSPPAPAGGHSLPSEATANCSGRCRDDPADGPRALAVDLPEVARSHAGLGLCRG